MLMDLNSQNEGVTKTKQLDHLDWRPASFVNIAWSWNHIYLSTGTTFPGMFTCYFLLHNFKAVPLSKGIWNGRWSAQTLVTN